jgi:16S rRNA (uracil1498-N3)-methyltransferase
MHRCFIESENWRNDRIVPSESESHHLQHVLRAEAGDAVAVFDGAGLEAQAVVRFDNTGMLELIVQEIKKTAARSVSITLITAIPKGSRADLIFEKATELGIARIIPVISDRVIVRLKAKQAEKKVERWTRIAKSAAKQCGTKWLPRIDAVQSFNEAIDNLSQFDAVLIGSLATGVRPFKTAIRELQKRNCNSIAVIIGPEGDLTAAETESALAAGAVPVSFGDLTLRAETAAIYALSVLSYEFLWTA